MIVLFSFFHTVSNTNYNALHLVNHFLLIRCDTISIITFTSYTLMTVVIECNQKIKVLFFPVSKTLDIHVL